MYYTFISNKSKLNILLFLKGISQYILSYYFYKKYANM